MDEKEYSLILDDVTCTFLSCSLNKEESPKTYVDVESLKKHLTDYHYQNISESVDSEIECGSRNCKKKFKKFISYFNHLNQNHTKYINNKTKETFVCKSLNLRSKFARMISEIKFTTNTSASNCDKFVNASFSLMSETLAEVKSEVSRYLTYKGLDISSSETKNFLDRLSFAPTINEFKSTRGQTKALKENFSFVEPKKADLGSREETVYNEEKDIYEKVMVPENFYYVSAIDILKLLMSNKEVFDYVENEKESTDGLVRGYRDANSFKKHEYLKKYPKALRLLLYYDDFLVNNPLGSKTHGNKIGGLYMSVQNLPHHLQLWKGNVHVLAFCYTADVTKYGISSILEPFMYDLGQLESDYGVKTRINGKDITLRATLVGFCGDNLAANLVLGYLGPGANKFCRLCTISRSQLQECSYIDGLERTKENHKKYVEQNLIDQTLESESGVREDTKLNESAYFHCTSNYTLDYMHDYLEGIAQYTLKLVVAHFVNSKDYDIDIELLHDRIHLFEYGITESNNKPAETFTPQSLNNPRDHKLKQTSAQLWLLLRVFPFLVSDKVDEDDDYLNILLTLNKTLEIIAAPKIDFSVLPYLQELLNSFDEQFRYLFPYADYINKLHNPFHSFKCTLESGPMAHYACFLYEATNRYYHEYATSNHCYKNLPATLINVSQIFQSSIWGTQKEQIRERLIYTLAEPALVKDLKYKKCVLSNNFKENDEVLKTNKIKIYSSQYSINLFVAIDSGKYLEDNMPIFGKIVEIFMVNTEVFFVCEEWITEGLKESLNAYAVSKGSKTVLINSNSLCDPKPFTLWKDYSAENFYISLRYLLF